MTETDDLSARLLALETVLRHLVTHLALRSDDPPGWVATRRVLALHELHEHPPHVHLAGLEQAISGFFDPVEGVMAEYAKPPGGTSRATVR
jgi:hypothetical protein